MPLLRPCSTKFMVECVFHVVADVCLGVFKVDFLDVLVGLGDFDAGTDLALGVKDLGSGKADRRLPAVTLFSKTVDNSVNAASDGIVII